MNNPINAEVARIVAENEALLARIEVYDGDRAANIGHIMQNHEEIKALKARLEVFAEGRCLNLEIATLRAEVERLTRALAEEESRARDFETDGIRIVD